MSPAPNHCRRRCPPRPVRNPQTRGPKPNPNPSQVNFPPIFSSCEMLRDDILTRYILSSGHFGAVRQVTIRLKLACSLLTRTLHRRCTPSSTPAPGRGAAMAVQVTPHPPWVADLDATLEPSRQAILDTAVIFGASENQPGGGENQKFLGGVYPLIPYVPPGVQMLL